MTITRIQLRRGTAAQWTAMDPVLADGEIGIESDTNKFKIGDGSTAWGALVYQGATGVAGVSSFNTRTGAVALSKADVTGTGLAASDVGADASGAATAVKGLPLALTGATAATRYVGGTASGAPASGTFAVGDFVIDQTGKVWVCTTAGSPGTWSVVSGGSGVSVQGSVGTNLGAAVTVDFASTAKKIILVGTLNANCTVTLANRAAGSEAVLLLTQDATGGRTLQVSDGTTPQSVTIASAAGALTIVAAECPDASTIDLAVVGGSGGTAAGALLAANNLSDLVSAATARTNLGLGSAATHPSTDFDASGAAAAVTAALTYQTLQIGGVSETQRGKLNLIAGTNVTITEADNAGANSSDVTITAASGGASSPNPQPSDQKLLAWTADPALSTANFAPTAGVLYLIKMPVRASTTFATLWVNLQNGGSGATALANSFLGLYVVSGSNLVLVGASADQSTPWTGGATQRNVSAALTVQAGQSLTQSTPVWGAILIGTQSTTALQVKASTPANGMPNIGQTAGTDALRSGTSGSAQTALPTSVAISSMATSQMAFMAAS